jgi:hypothetical protein
MSSNLNDSIPAPPAGNTNVQWQTDGSGNDSAYVPTSIFTPADVSIVSLIPGDVLVWNGSIWVNAGLPSIIALNLPIFANNAAAITGGLVAGNLYRTGGDPDIVAVVH